MSTTNNSFITSVEREVKDSRRSGITQSCFICDKIEHSKSVGFRFIRLFDEVRTELVHFDFIDLFFNLIGEERLIIHGFPGV